MTATDARLVKCKQCGSLVSEKRLQRHISRVHHSSSAGSSAHSKKPELPERLMSKALDLAPKKGFGLLSKLADEYAPNADLYYNMGGTLLRLGELERATACFEDALKLEHDNMDAQRSLDLTRKAIRILAQNEVFKESDVEWMGNVASAARSSDLFGIALKIGEMMVELDTGGGALNDLGLTYQCMGKYDRAIELYDGALAVEPDMPEALSQKALCLMLTDKLDEASVLYAKAVQVRPNFLSGWYNLGVISMRKNNYEQAIKQFDKAIELNAEYYMAWFAKSQALKGLNRWEEAAKCLMKSIELNPEYVGLAVW